MINNRNRQKMPYIDENENDKKKKNENKKQNQKDSWTDYRVWARFVNR